MASTLLPGSAAAGPTPSHLAQQVLHTMPWGVLACDRQGRLRLLNPYAARLLGCPAAEVLGQPLTQVLPPGFPPELRAALHAALTSPGPVTGEFYLPAGQQWLEMTTDPSGPAEVLVYWQDITRVVTKRQQYQALADNTPDALARWDAALHLRYANPAMEAKIGQPLPFLLGKTLSETGVPAAIAEPFMAAVQRVFATGQPQQQFTTLPSPRGEQYYHTRLVPEVHDGEAHTVLSIGHNITEIKRAELAAAAQAHFSTQLATTSPDRILVRELATGQVLYVNQAVLPELGYDPDQAAAAHARGEAPFPGDARDEAALAAYWAAFATATDDEVPTLEHRLQALDGTWHWYRMRGKVFARDAAGRPTQALSVAAGITAEKQAEAELLRLQLTQQQQLANAVLNAQEVERRRIAEDLHNGLGQLLYATKLHLDALGAAPAPAVFIAGKRQATELLATAIAQVRTLSHQLIPTVLEDFGLAAGLREICQKFRHLPLHLHCTVEELPPLPLPLALACYRMAQELVNNLVQHAGATEAHLHLAARASWLELRIADNGRGFDPALPRPPGLGLNALRDRVQLLGGELTIASAQGQGTQVGIRVPYATDAAAHRLPQQ